MKTSPAELEKWSRLYRLMDEIKELTPWEWMDEADIFGVQNPVKDEIGFVSIMGQLGEHFAVAIYLGAEGLYGFWAMKDAGPDLQYETVLEVPQLQASFENKNMLDQPDKKIISELELLYRGKNSWPLFRAYHPGFFPWFLQEDERDFMIPVLEQSIQVAKRSLNDRALLEPQVDDRYLVRVSKSTSGKLEWQDQWLTIPPPKPKPLSPNLDLKTVSAMTSMPVRDLTVEIDLFNTGMVIQDKGRRPHFAHLLLTVDQKTGLVLSNNLLSPLPSREAMWESVPQKVIENLVKLDLRPQQVLVKEGLMYQLLLVLSKKTDLPVVAVKNLPSINAARQHLMKSKQR